jgi:hypothetical protein
MVLQGGSGEDASTPTAPAAAPKPPTRNYVELLCLLDSQVQLHLNPPRAADTAPLPVAGAQAVPVEAQTASTAAAATEIHLVPVEPKSATASVRRRRLTPRRIATMYIAAALAVGWTLVQVVGGLAAKTKPSALAVAPSHTPAAPTPLIEPAASMATQAAPTPTPAPPAVRAADPRCSAAAAALALCTPNLPR